MAKERRQRRGSGVSESEENAVRQGDFEQKKEHSVVMRVRPYPTWMSQEWVLSALQEDLMMGDVTTDLCVAQGQWGEAVVFCKDARFVLAGVEVFQQVFQTLDDDVTFHWQLEEGGARGVWGLEAEELPQVPPFPLVRLRGRVHALLCAERVALNVLARMSGIATETKRLLQGLQGLSTELLDTRKTTPGMKALEKYAARLGGARNHRFNLSDGVLIKENHIRAVGSVSEAVRRVQGRAPALLQIEVEVSCFEELQEALSLGEVQRILCDNMSVAELKRCVDYTAQRVPLEASGNITAENIRRIAQTGVDSISTSAMFRAPPVDFSFLLEDRG